MSKRQKRVNIKPKEPAKWVAEFRGWPFGYYWRIRYTDLMARRNEVNLYGLDETEEHKWLAEQIANLYNEVMP